MGKRIIPLLLIILCATLSCTKGNENAENDNNIIKIEQLVGRWDDPGWGVGDRRIVFNSDKSVLYSQAGVYQFPDGLRYQAMWKGTYDEQTKKIHFNPLATVYGPETLEGVEIPIDDYEVKSISEDGQKLTLMEPVIKVDGTLSYYTNTWKRLD